MKKGFNFGRKILKNPLINSLTKPLITKGLDKVQDKILSHTGEDNILGNLTNLGRNILRNKTGYGVRKIKRKQKTKLKLNI